MPGNRWLGVSRAVLLAGALASCSALQSGPLDGAQAELNRQRRQWRAQEIEDYSYTVRRLCFCPESFTDPVEVRVSGGEVVARSYRGSGEAVAGENARFWPPVEGLFEIVQDAIDRDADSLLVDYHPSLGYPISIRIDYEEMAIDEELTVTASDLDRQ